MTEIYFNDTLIGTTDRQIDYCRETDDQKEYRLTDVKRGMTAVFFCADVKLIPAENITVEIL